MTNNSRDYQTFGEKNSFALEVRLIPDPDDNRHAPKSSVGSWGEWSIWVAGNNLCRMNLSAGRRILEAEHVRWYLAPLFRWLLDNWSPLLHEAKLPGVISSMDVKPRWARGSYLSALQRFGDDEEFAHWQEWAHRHAIRTSAEGGIFPDIFFQRVGDEIEISWGDRVSPGAEVADFLLEEGGSRTGVATFGQAMNEAIVWFSKCEELAGFDWHKEMRSQLTLRNAEQAGAKLSWFLDSSRNPGKLSAILQEHSRGLIGWLSQHSEDLWLSPLTPQVAMFGAVSPAITETSAAKLIGILMSAEGSSEEPTALKRLVEDIPAWSVASPWDDGYSLALDILDEIDPSPDQTYTDIEGIINKLEVQVVKETLGVEGPRGVAIAGVGYTPTLVSNEDHVNNTGRGLRFTLAHELCHILFDRDKAKSIFHSSTPWAHPAVEQRANAFAAMLLMPPKRIRFDKTAYDLNGTITELARNLNVSKVSLIYHLRNLGQISEEQRDDLLQPAFSH